MISEHVDVSVSVVVYRDYEKPLKMINTLASQRSNAISVLVYVIDNSELMVGDDLCERRDAFIANCMATGIVKYIDMHDNLGFGKANNIALFLADSDYHAFINPDIVFVEDSLTILKEFMDKNASVGMCIPLIVDNTGNRQDAYRKEVTVLDAFNRMFLRNRLVRRASEHSLMNQNYQEPFQVPFGQGCFLFGRTSLLKSLNGFDKEFFMYLEDADLCRRVNQVSTFMYCPYTKVIHGWERGSQKSIRLLYFHIRSYVRYFLKWGIKLW